MPKSCFFAVFMSTNNNRNLYCLFFLIEFMYETPVCQALLLTAELFQ